MAQIKIKFSLKSKKWLEENNVHVASLTRNLIKLCRVPRGISSKLPQKIFIKICPRARNSEYRYNGNYIKIGIDCYSKASRETKVKNMLRALLHEIRHFIQYRCFCYVFHVSYSQNDVIKGTSRYYNDPLEKDARKFERYYKPLFRKVFKRLE